mgnify:FL=1
MERTIWKILTFMCLCVVLSTASPVRARATQHSSSRTMGKSVRSELADWKGKVLDESDKAMPYVNIVVLSMPDSLVLDGTVTDEDGVFSLPSHTDEEILMVTMIGYETEFLHGADGAVIHLRPVPEMLAEAGVKAFMPKTKLTGQGMSTSVRGTVLENIGSAKDALSRVPGVYKGRNGLEVIGRGKPVVYINGRRVQDESELERLRSNEIQNVEVIENPGAGYDASVNCVIRIKTFRPQGEGLGFNMGLSDDQSLIRKSFNDPSGYANFNYRKGGLDLFAGANGTVFNHLQSSVITGEITKGSPRYQEGPFEVVSESRNYTLNAGFNYMIGSNHFVGARVDYTRSPFLDYHQQMYSDVFRSGELVEQVKSVSENWLEDGNIPTVLAVNTYYNGTVGKLNIDFNADYYGSGNTFFSRVEETSSMTGNAEIESKSESESDMYAAKLVLAYPIWLGRFQIGTEDTYALRGSDYSITGTYVPSSSSRVKEENYAAFADYAFYHPVLGQVSAGVRYEYVRFRYHSLTSNEDEISRKYSNLFPSVTFARAFGPVQTQLIYSIKTSRPSFSNLSDNMMYHSKFILQSGNAKLQPQTTQQVSMTARWNFLTASAQYSRTDDAIVSWGRVYSNDQITDDDVVVHVLPVNLVNPFRELSCYLNASPTIGIWTMNYTVGIMKQWLDIDMSRQAGYEEAKVVSFSRKPMFIAQTFNSFNFKNDWMVELGMEYHSKGFYQNVYLANTVCDLSCSVQKAFLRDKSLVVRLSASDLLWKQRSDVQSDYGFVNFIQTNAFNTKKISLSVTYRFNSASSKYKGTGAGKDTASRIK